MDDGLPSNTVYDMAMDGSGTLWIATNRGLAVINGSNTTTFTENDGLPHNNCWQVVVDNSNVVWVGTFGGGLTYYNGKAFGTINQDNGLADNRIRKLYYRSPNLYVGTQNGVSIINTKTKAVQSFKESEQKLQVMDFFEHKGKIYFITFTTGSYRIDRNGIFKVNDDKAFFSAMVKNDSLYLSKDGNPTWLNSIHKTSMDNFLSNKRNYWDFGDSVFWHLQSIEGRTYGAAWGVNFESGGFFEVKQNGLIPLNKRYGINSQKVYSMLHLPDTRQLLLATLDNGIQILDLEHMVALYPKDNLKCSLTTVDGDVLYGFEEYLEIQSETNISIISKRDFMGFVKKGIANGTLETRFPQKGHFRDFSLKQERFDSFFKINSISEFEGSIYVGTQIGIFRLDKKGNGFEINDFYPISAANRFYIGTELGLIFQYPYSNVIMFDVPNHPKQIKRFELDDPNSPRDIINFIKLGDRLFAVSRFKGIFFYENGAITSLLQNGSITEREFVTARQVSDSSFLAADYRGNIYRLTYDGAINFEKVVDNKNLTGNAISAVETYGDYIIANSNRGLNFFNLHTGIKRFLDQEQGFVASGIKDIQVWNSTLILTSTKGVYDIALNKLLDNHTKVVSIDLDNLKVNGNDINRPDSDSFLLNHDQNRLDISLKGKNIKYPKKVFYRYRIVGLDNAYWTDWKSWHDEKHFGIPYLPAGDFDIELEYRDDFSGQVGCSKIVRLTIERPFWNTIPFYLLAVLIIISIVFILIRWRFKVLNKRQKQKSMIEKRIAEAKMEALRSQMNPHFVFNAIGAIQNFVIDNDTDSSLDYMNSFSKLIRKTLDYSSKKSITIQEEVDFLKLFVKIQNLRFGNQVRFTIRVQKTIDKNHMEIPPMLLQPIVENCFEHAFDDSIKTPKINLFFELKGLFLEITVRDTGHGIKNTVRAKSKGLKLVEEHLKLIHPENRLEITSDTTGTSVKILLGVL